MDNLVLEIKRKLVHISSIFYIIIYCLIKEFFSQSAAILVLVFILICLSFLEFLKMKFNKKIPFFHHLYRENERNTISGSIYLILGVIIAFSAFGLPVIALARIPVVDLAVGFIFLNNIIVILFMAIIATIVETLLKPVDDNLAIPVVAGFAGQALMMILGHL